MRLRRLLFGRLATALLWQTLLISVLPMLVIAIAALYASNSLVRTQVAEQAKYVAGQVSSELLGTAATATQTAELLAESPTSRDLTAAGDRGQFAEFLRRMKSRLGVDVLDVSDPSGTVIASAQDSAGGEGLPDALIRHMGSGTSSAWALTDGPQGPVLHAIAPIRGASGDVAGLMHVGVLLGPVFLRSKQFAPRTELALILSNRVGASTFALDGAQLPSGRDVAARPSHKLSRMLTIGGNRYLATFTTIESHGDGQAMLAVFAPLAPMEAMTRGLWVLLSILGLILCIAVVLLTSRMARSIIAPFRQLVSAALRIQSGDLGARVELKAQHEIRVLEVAFNTMIDSLGERERERLCHEAELLHLASHDALTGLPNRSLLERALNESVAEAELGRPSTLMYIDLDQFKIVNDTLGHGSGDRLLITLAGLVRSVLRDEDILARLGGDEFAALLPGLRMEDAMPVAERVRRAVDEYRFVESGQGFAVGVSVGVTAITGSGSASEVLGQADMACYTAKSEGRNRVAVYEPHAATLALLSGDGKWTVELKDALHDNRLQLVFQPVMRLGGRCIDHYESLVRLVGRQGDLIGPAAFIPTAERSGLIRDIDHWVLNAALRRMRQEDARGNPIRLAINLSGITLSSSESAAFIRHEIEANGVDPSALIFEITETALMTNLARGQTTIEVLREIGCCFALDDFGSGTSSFTYLAQLPVDSVKIDGSFVRDVATNAVNQAIVQAIAHITRSMGKQSVAEWVEDADTLKTLRRLHVDLAQGYFIGSPSSQLVDSSGLFAMGYWPVRARAERAAVR